MEENGLYPDSQDTFGQQSIGAYKLGTAIRVSEELLNDSVFDLESYIAGEFARRIGTKEEEAFLTGDGKNKPTGVFPSANWASLPMELPSRLMMSLICIIPCASLTAARLYGS